MIKKRRLGKTGQMVSILGLGGEGVLRTNGRSTEAVSLINAAIDAGINYLESARVYAGSETYYGLALKERRRDIFLTTKTHARDKKGALEHLAQSLKELKTDYIDLWQIHDVRTEKDFSEAFGPSGAIEALVEARQKGLVRFLGVTGHEDPGILKKFCTEFDFDTALIPVNPAEPHYKSFIDEIAPVASNKDMGLIAMKTYLRGMIDMPRKLLYCYALTQPVTTAVIGCDNVEQLKENVEIAENYQPVKTREMSHIRRLVEPYARELLFYKP